MHASDLNDLKVWSSTSSGSGAQFNDGMLFVFATHRKARRDLHSSVAEGFFSPLCSVPNEVMSPFSLTRSWARSFSSLSRKGEEINGGRN